MVRDGRGIVLLGAVGTGKDHLLAAMLYRAVHAGFACRWLSGQEFYGDLRDRMDSGKAEEQRFRELQTPDVLAISDPIPPVGSPTAWNVAQLYRLLDRRYRVSALNLGVDECGVRTGRGRYAQRAGLGSPARKRAGAQVLLAHLSAAAGELSPTALPARSNASRLPFGNLENARHDHRNATQQHRTAPSDGALVSVEVLAPVMTVEQALARYRQLQDVARQLLRENHDFGVIPGTEGKDGKPARKVLLQPGDREAFHVLRFAAHLRGRGLNAAIGKRGSSRSALRARCCAMPGASFPTRAA